MKKRYPVLYVLLLSLLALTACGGGGGGGTPASNDPSPDPDAFSLATLKSLQPSQTLSFPAMTGSDTNGDIYKASLTISNLPAVTILGLAQTAIPIQSEISLTNVTTGGVNNTKSASYYAPGYTLVIVRVDMATGVTCIPTSFSAPPDFVFLGDSDKLADLTCSDGASIVITWFLEAGSTTDEARFVIVKSSSNGGTLITIEEDSYVIDKAGNVKAIEVNVYNVATDVTLNLSGTRQ